MSVNSKANATGRSTGVRIGRDKKLNSPPKDEPWVWQQFELVNSPAWRGRSIHAVRLIDALQCDHMAHGGRENGNLMATYDQLVERGISRRLIPDAIAEAQFLGLIAVKRGGNWEGSYQPSTYRLTWLKDHEGRPATNQWKTVTKDAIKEWKKRRRKEAAENRIPVPACGTPTEVQHVELQTKAARNRAGRKKPKKATLLKIVP